LISARSTIAATAFKAPRHSWWEALPLVYDSGNTKHR
jgi:hypothetical protein